MNREELATKFVQAGYAEVEIEPADLQVIGLDRIPKSYTSVSGHRRRITHWEAFCVFIHEHQTQTAAPRCPLTGRGFRSKWHGRLAARAIAPEQFEEVV